MVAMFVSAAVLPGGVIAGTASAANTVKLSNGVELPLLLFGTPSCGTRSGCSAGAGDAVAEAIPLGFQGVDTAAHYNNQAGVADGIRRSGAARGSVFIGSKVEACNNTFVRLGHCYEDTKKVFLQNLEELNTSQVSRTHACHHRAGRAERILSNQRHRSLMLCSCRWTSCCFTPRRAPAEEPSSTPASAVRRAPLPCCHTTCHLAAIPLATFPLPYNLPPNLAAQPIATRCTMPESPRTVAKTGGRAWSGPS